MDLLRGAAVVLVMVLHADLSADGRSDWILNNLFRPYRMPMLMLLSGLLLQRSLDKGARRYLVGKVRGVVWPWVVWTGVMAALLTERFLADPVGFLAVGTHMWFLAALACAYLLALVARQVPPWAIAALTFSLAGLLQDTHGALTTYLWYGSFFFVGAALRPWMDRWVSARPPVPLVLTAVAVAGALWQVPRGLYVPFRPDQVLIAVAGILAIVWLAARVPRTAPVRAVEWMGRNSIVAYLVHPALLIPVGAAVGGLGLTPAVTSVVNLVLVLALSVLLILARPWTEWLYGMPRVLQPGLEAAVSAAARVTALPAVLAAAVSGPGVAAAEARSAEPAVANR